MSRVAASASVCHELQFPVIRLQRQHAAAAATVMAVESTEWTGAAGISVQLTVAV